MSHYIANVRDLEFNLFEVLGLGAVLDAGGYGDLDEQTSRTMLSEVARLAEDVIAESFVDADRNPPVFLPDEHRITVPGPLAKTVQAVKDAEWWRVGLDERAGGTAAPAALVWAIQEMVVSANGSGAFFYLLGPAMAHTLAEVGTEQQRRWARIAMDKGWAGTMVLTEPDAGSERRCGPDESGRADRRQLAHRGRQALHLRRRRRRHRRERFPPGAGPPGRGRSRNQGTEPVLCAELPVRPRHPGIG